MQNQLAVKNGDNKAVLTRQKSRAFFVISQMPPKSHWPDKPERFDVMNSEVCQWLVAQPDFMMWVIQKARDLGAIEFVDGRWVGINYDLRPITAQAVEAIENPKKVDFSALRHAAEVS